MTGDEGKNMKRNLWYSSCANKEAEQWLVDALRSTDALTEHLWRMQERKGRPQTHLWSAGTMISYARSTIKVRAQTQVEIK